MLSPVLHHPWDLPPTEAIQLQRELAGRVRPDEPPDPIETVAGIDVSIRQGMAQAGVVVMALATLETLEYRRALAPVTYPYVPGLLSFREAPVILEALACLTHTPDVLMLDAQGIAHPRRLGLAAHLGVVLDHPTIGCAKSRLCGAHEEPGPLRGAFSWLTEADAIIGAVLRTRTHVRPVYVSIGHRMTIESAIALVLRCGGRYRLPEPTRWAHHVAGGREP